MTVKVIKSEVAGVFQKLKAKTPAINVATVLVYNIIVKVLSVRERSFTQIIEKAAKRLASSSNHTPKLMESSWGRTITRTPKYPKIIKAHLERDTESFKTSIARIVVNKGPVIPIDVAKARGKCR